MLIFTFKIMFARPEVKSKRALRAENPWKYYFSQLRYSLFYGHEAISPLLASMSTLLLSCRWIMQ